MGRRSLGTMRWTWAVAGTVAVGLVAGGVAVGSAARAETQLCAKYAQTRTEGGYVAQNNLWGADTPQCIGVSGDGFTVTRSTASRPTNGAPASYPSLFWGCHYGTCTTGFSPVRADSAAFARVRTSAEFGFVDSGAWDASYDIWFDPTSRTNGQDTGAEIMIWMNSRGGVQPVGGKVGTATIAGATWDVWEGNIGWNVVSYVRTAPSTTISTAVGDFYGDAVRRGYAQTSWYLTSVQAGFEPWVGGTGLSLASFAVTTDGSAPSPTPTTPTTTPTTPPAAQAACRITVRRDEWQGGFVRYVTVTNTGPTAVNGWTLTARAAAGTAVTSGWGAAWSQSGTALRATNLDWNATVAPGGTVSLGYQGTWTTSDAYPAGWALNGSPCSG
jgi:hypothetical protein